MNTIPTIVMIIYLIGYILAYRILRDHVRRKKGKAYYSWEDVSINLLASSLSWVIHLLEAISWVKTKIRKSKFNVPKWL